jgi:uncharacterized iron-regulated protein
VAAGAEARSTLDTSAVVAGLAGKRVVLLGENHDNAEHHRWQLHTIAALYALRPRLAIGLEMFPRRVQKVLDQWTAGELSEEQFLSRSEWAGVWGHDPQLYMPLFHFARMHRLRMIALNVDRDLVRRVGAQGLQAVPPADREGIGEPAPPSERYLAFLYRSFLEHQAPGEQPAPAPSADALRNPQFLRFVDSMLLWDRAMAEAIAAAAAAGEASLIVAIMGSGHLRDGYGVPHQLRSLGIENIAVALPWDTGEDCASLTAGVADLVFGLAVRAEPAAKRPRLGVVLERGAQGVAIREVLEDSIAARAGARTGDVITMVAGVPAQDPDTVIAAVQRQAPGTWLPLTVKRDGALVELIARFPARP